MAPSRLLLLPLIAACSEYGAIGYEGDIDSLDSGSAEEEVVDEFTEYDGASLVVDSPASGDVLPWGDESDFEAYVVGADGTTMDFEDIVWTTSVDDWTATGTDFENDDLDVGEHTLTIEALLPNGDRLQTQLGAVRVQHPDAGIYAGSMIVDLTADYDGTDITASCIGAVTLIVDAYGEAATGDSSCLVSLLGYELETAYIFDLGLDGEDVEGDASIDLFGYELAMDALGGIGEGALDAAWSGSLAGFADVAGELDATRVSLDTELPD
jgi:hypothetical protein